MFNNQHSFLDIESTLIAWLGELLDVPAFADLPEDLPDRFITIERTGGSSDNIVIDRPIVSIQCWATSRLGAGLLANEVAAASALMPREIPRITKAAVSSRFNIPASQGDTTKPCYQVTIDLVTR